MSSTNRGAERRTKEGNLGDTGELRILASTPKAERLEHNSKASR
jgi:hypothetical protein